WQDSTGIGTGTIGSSIFENYNFQAPNDTSYVTNYIVHEPISGKTFAFLTTVLYNDSYVAEVVSLNPPILGTVNVVRNSFGNDQYDPTVFTVSADGFIWLAVSGGSIVLKLDPNSLTFWQSITETSYSMSSNR